MKRMGRVRNRRARADAKKKGYKRSRSTKRRARDIDQIQDDLRAQVENPGKVAAESRALQSSTQPLNDDLPGRGQFYCVETARHFESAHALAAHKKTKAYKKRLKRLAEKQFTQEEADAAGGVQTEKYVPWRVQEEQERQNKDRAVSGGRMDIG